MNKFALVALLLVASTFAAHDFGFRSHHARPHYGSQEDVLNFAKGFLKGIGEDNIFNDIKSCIADSQTFYKDVATAIADIRSKVPAKVKEGIALLGKAVQFLPTAARDCHAAEVKIKKLIKLVFAFTNPQSFIYHIAKSLLINHVEIINEVSQVVAAYEHKDFFNLGYWTGKAMDTIFLGLNQPLRQGLVDFLNNNQNSWTAEIPSKFANMTLQQIKDQYLGAVPDFMHYNVEEFNGPIRDIPESFNSSEQWPGCIHPIRDQGHCGSCWAFAASEVLSDRFCIATNSSVNLVLAPQSLVSCDTLNYGCQGGYPSLSWSYIATKGLVTESCWPYASYNGTVPKCNTFSGCADGKPATTYLATKTSIVQLTTPQAIQNNILQYGPVEATFSVYEDFMNYKGGIYKHTSGSLLGGHAVKIIGWGKEDNTNYWIVANSWNTTWGVNGFFKIAFGEVGIDRACIAGRPDTNAQTPNTVFA